MTDAIDRGISLLRTAAKAKPHDVELHLSLMAALCRKGLLNEVVSEFIQYVKGCPEWTQLHFELISMLMRREGFFEQVYRAFAADQSTPAADAFIAHYGRGLVLTVLNMQNDAIKAFEAAIRLNDDYAPAYHNMGLSYHFSNRTAEAIEACRTATIKSETMAEPHFFLSTVYMNTGNLGLALSHNLEFIRLAKPYLANYIPSAKQSVQILKEKIKNPNG